MKYKLLTGIKKNLYDNFIGEYIIYTTISSIIDNGLYDNLLSSLYDELRDMDDDFHFLLCRTIYFI
jgi:hypothetical protein